MNEPFTFYGTIKTPELPDNLDWEEYTYRQKTHLVHKETKTIPLIWDEKLTGKVIYHSNYRHFKDFLNSLSSIIGKG